MADNRVEVRVGARTSELEQGMNDAEQIVDNAADNIEDTGRNIDFIPDFSSFRSSIDSISQLVTTRFEEVGTSISASFTRSFAMVGLGITAAVGTAMIGLANLTNQVGEASKELENQARLANATTTEFQEWAFAAKKVSVEQDKLSDVMKDVNDKFGDFMQTGGGEMADFFEKIAPKVGVTAKEFQGLSGPQILEKYYQTLQKANVSQAEMTFYMESLADDATLLAPLLENNSDKLKDFSQQAHDLGLVMDEQAIRATKEFSSALGIIQETMQGVLNNMAAQAAPILTELANKFLDFAARSKEGIDGSVTAIITIFENLLGIVQSVFTLISDIWNDLTADIGDGAISQISFIDLVSGVMKGFAAVAVGLRVSIEIAFAAIRAVVSTVCQAINIAINTVLNVFGGFRDSIQLGLDVLSVKFQAFGNVVNNVLSFNFSGAKASWESGLSQIGSITDRYTNQMKARANDLKNSWNMGVMTAQNSWGSFRDKSVQAATKGNDQLTNMFFPAANSSKVAPPPLPTFNPNFGIGTGVKNAGGSGGSSAKAKADADADAKAKQRAAEQEAKALADIRYKYATEEEKIALDLQKALSEIEKSKATDAEKAKFRIVAEKESSDKTKALRVKEFEEVKKLQEQRIENEQLAAQRRYEIEMEQIQAAFDAKKISNVQKFQLEKELEDQLRALKRQGLQERFELENQMSEKSGKQGNQNQIINNISGLDTEQTVANLKAPELINKAQIKDFETMFGGLTSRMSNLWDQGIQSMMNGTLTWRNATNAILTDMAGFFIQKMISEPIKLYAKGLAQRLLVRLGFIKSETSAEVMGQAAQSTAVVAGETTKTAATGMGVVARLGLKAGEAIKSIMMYAWEAMAGAFKAMVSIPYVGPVLAIAAGASALALVGGLAGKIKSARGGYDIPSGVNPVTQLHEEEMVLPKQHANTIRALGKSMAGGGQNPDIAYADVGAPQSINIQAWDSRDLKRFMKKHGRELAGGLKGYNRNFGK
ncbi:phage tail protein [Acinetobacter gyllenbergii]|nr:phage tail protein [Acinetobacter gyllenbergii]